MDRVVRWTGTSSVVLVGVTWMLACAPRQESAGSAPVGEARPASDTALLPPAARRPVASRDVIQRDVPYEGAFGPADPPKRAPAMQKPLEPWVTAALDFWYERPSPGAPEPIPVANPKALYVVGQGAVLQILPGPPAFPDKIPERLRTVMPDSIPYSNNVRRLPAGRVRLVAFDHTLNDTKRSRDSMALELSFTDAEGAEWRIEQVTLAPISPNPINEPWFGGLAIDTLYHGNSGNGTPADALVNCALCSWGWADIYKDGKRVASSALLHLMVTSDVRAPASENYRYQCYDCTQNPVREIHIVVPPSAQLPSPGGFLHVNWENAEIRRGTPAEIARTAPTLAEDVPTIELAAAPYLRWDKTEIRVKTGQKYRLLVHNQDPSSFHQFRLHAEPAGAGHHAGGADSLRHEEGMTAGGIGPLWKPGEAAKHEENPPGPQNVFFPLPQGSTWATMVMFEKPGEYEFMCPVGNHYRRGMEGKFIVEGESAVPVRKDGRRP